MTPFTIPELSLVLLVGPSGCGKSTFARKHFRPTEVLSSDFFRGMVCDDQAEQGASKAAFEILHVACARRLAFRRLTVIDATNLLPEARRPLLALARQHHYRPVAIVFNLAEDLCVRRNQQRTERIVGAGVVHTHAERLRLALPALQAEGFDRILVLNTPEEVEAALIAREPPPTDRRADAGPFDVVGDVHGCFEELVTLLKHLGYGIEGRPDAAERLGYEVRPPAGRKVVFVGDLVDRGPNTPGALRLAMGMVEAGTALCVCGNHDFKLLRKLRGNDVKVAHGLALSLEQMEPEPVAFKEHVRRFLDGLPSYYLLDGGRLVVAHAGLKEEMQGRTGAAVRSFTMYGDTTGRTDEHGMPERRDWASEYRGAAQVVYGHTPVPESIWVNRTINIDTGCVFGGKLTALRYPEMELVSVPAARRYCSPGRPFQPPAPQTEDTQPPHELV
jgi:protein phosphatase